MPAKRFPPDVGVGWSPGAPGEDAYVPSEDRPGRLGTVALLLALLGLALSCLAGTSAGMAVTALVCTLTAGILAVIALVRRRSDAGRATAGLMLSMVCLLVMLIALAGGVSGGGG